MQCFMCVMYMIIVTSANPTKTREITPKPGERSLFHDVLESFRIRSQHEEVGQNEENNLAHNFIRYGLDDLQLQGDTEYVPRRNDRLEMPSLKNRFPKSIKYNVSQNKIINIPQEEVNVYVNRNVSPKMDEYLVAIKNKEYSNNNKYVKSDHVAEVNQMSGLNEIDNRDSRTIGSPSVIADIPESINHQGINTKVEGNETIIDIIRKFLSLYQEIVVKDESENEGVKKKGANKKKYDVNLESTKGKTNDDDVEADIMKSGKKINKYQKYDDVLHVMFSI